MGNKRYAREHKGVWGQKNCSDNHKILQFWNKALGLNYTKNKGKKKKIKKPWLYAENTYFKESFFCGICDLFEGFIFACARNAFYLTLNSPVLKEDWTLFAFLQTVLGYSNSCMLFVFMTGHQLHAEVSILLQWMAAFRLLASLLQLAWLLRHGHASPQTMLIRK